MSIKENLRLEINNYKTIYIRFNLIEGFSLETMGLTLWNTEAFFQNLSYRHKERQNTEGNFKERKL